jgi:hypothetical protein
MLECWNTGMMGIGILHRLDSGKMRRNDKIINGKNPLKTIIPSFHYSIIPCLGQNKKLNNFLELNRL